MGHVGSNALDLSEAILQACHSAWQNVFSFEKDEKFQPFSKLNDLDTLNSEEHIVYKHILNS